MNNVVEYTEFLVKSICESADLVKVSLNDTEDGLTILDVLVSESDMPRVIGKSGRNASSIRTLVLAYAYVNKLGRIKINFESF